MQTEFTWKNLVFAFGLFLVNLQEKPASFQNSKTSKKCILVYKISNYFWTKKWSSCVFYLRHIANPTKNTESRQKLCWSKGGRGGGRVVWERPWGVWGPPIKLEEGGQRPPSYFLYWQANLQCALKCWKHFAPFKSPKIQFGALLAVRLRILFPLTPLQIMT